MRRAEFMRAVEAEFGGLGAVLLEDQVLAALQGKTARAALDAGAAPRKVWEALCAANDVPPERRSGTRLLPPESA
ncbi:MAG TPA: DUF3046 domain-containing protein [Candidatus Agrococcus pullicola]|uniref:DUF3046 domain-containing protein n=1 Tax=Candidatus Agrococcus pullicola TaxID=2838429 RepID=A0A9D1YTV9_9MICO|nr:DUF3046 domain-containing protein [Candidatus Agrococcus pullicola]